MASIPLEWTISIKGGNEVKTTLAQLNEEWKKGTISKEEYNKALVRGNRTAAQSLNIDRYQANILKAQYPALQKVSRAMSTVTSISRSLLTISNALNISKISGKLQDIEVMTIQKDLNELKRKRNELEAAGLKGGKDWLTVVEDINIKEEELKKRNQELTDQDWSNMITHVESAILGVGTIFTNLINNPTIFKALVRAGSFFGGAFSGFFKLMANPIAKLADWLVPGLTGKTAMQSISKAGMKNGSIFGLSFVGGMASAIAGILTGVLLATIIFPTLDEVLRKNSSWYDAYAKWRDQESNKNANMLFGKDSETKKSLQETAPGWFGPAEKTQETGLPKQEEVGEQVSFWQPVIDLFTKTIPEALVVAKDGFFNMFKATTDLTNLFGAGLVSGINNIFGELIASMNKAISSYNKAAKKMGKSTISSLSFTPSAFTPIPAIAAAKGFNGIVNSPTMFLAGEAGMEHVAITPSGGSRGGQMIVNVYGSVWNERQLFSKLDAIQKQNYKSRGFTGT